MIVGDFNVHWDKSHDRERQQLSSLFETFNLVQHVTTATHTEGHILDLIVTRQEEDLVASCGVGDFISDHRAILVQLNCGKPHPIRKIVSFRKIKSLNSALLEHDIMTSDLHNAELDNVDDAVAAYNTVLCGLLDKYAPLQTRSVAERPPTSWISADILQAKRERRRSERVWRKSGLIVHRDIYRQNCMHVKELIQKSKIKHFQTKIEECEGDQRKLFQIVDKLLGRGKTTSLPTASSSLALAESFNSFFISKIATIRQDLSKLERSTHPLSFDLNSELKHCNKRLSDFQPTTKEEIQKIILNSSKASCILDPLPSTLLRQVLPPLLPVITHIVNLCLSSGHFPSVQKSAIVKPLLKKSSLSPEMFKNFRPVSNLPFLSKVIEKVVAVRLVDHLIDNSLLDDMQSAYRRHHSTETALLSVHNDLLTAVDEGKCAFLVLLDLSAAFDTVDHTILLSFLEHHIGLSGSVLGLLQSYLTGRTQCVSVDNILSDVSSLEFGVPQGSVLGPIAFCIYTLPLCTILRHHKLQYHIYADDTQIYFSFNILDSASSLLKIESCISDIRSWMIKNKLKINDSKTEFLVISSPKSTISRNIHLTIGQSSINPSESCRNLGVTFDQHLTMEKHIRVLCKTIHFHLRNIGAVRHLLTDRGAAQLIHALVTSRFDYCNSLLYGLPESKINILQKMQNIAARIVSRCPKFSHITPILHDLHWLPIKFRILFKILVFTYQVLDGTAPAYLCQLLETYQETRSLRSSEQHLLAMPKTRLRTYGDRSFMAAAPREWNNLPLELRLAPTLDSFKRALKSFLFKRYFDN